MAHVVCGQVAIFGEGEVEPSKENAVFICLEGCKSGLPKLLAMKMALLDFEARKDAAQARACFVVSYITARDLHGSGSEASYPVRLFKACLSGNTLLLGLLTQFLTMRSFEGSIPG